MAVCILNQGLRMGLERKPNAPCPGIVRRLECKRVEKLDNPLEPAGALLLAQRILLDGLEQPVRRDCFACETDQGESAQFGQRLSFYTGVAYEF